MTRDIVDRLEAPAYRMSGSTDGHGGGGNDAPREAAAEIRALRAKLAPIEALAKLYVAQGEAMTETRTKWHPPPAPDREDGFECLAFHRGKWRHVKWRENRWSLGYGVAFIKDGARAFAPIPEKPKGADGFYDWKD